MSTLHSVGQIAKELVGLVAQLMPKDTFYLGVSPRETEEHSVQDLRSVFARLDVRQQNSAYLLRWEMARMEDTRIFGDRWGEEHFWEEPQKVAVVLHRLGVLGSEGRTEIAYNLRLLGGHEKAHSFYYSLSEKWGRDPVGGWISYVNGMGTSHSQAGRDAAKFSDLFAKGCNLHCVYLPTRQDSPMGDSTGFTLDALRYLAVLGGGHTRCSCLIAQQWIDYLTQEPEKCFLQTCHSEGATHVNAALRVLRENRPDLIPRLRIITFCAATLIHPLPVEELQVINFFKLEDLIPAHIGGGCLEVERPSLHIRAILHTKEAPHYHLSQDYVVAAKPHFELFMRTGSLFP